MTLALQLVVLLLVALGGLLVARLTRLPSIPGYLLGGLLAGPAVLDLVHHSTALDAVAELGVALLLFGVGIEFSIGEMRASLGRLVTAGLLQVTGTIALAALLFRQLDLPWSVALVLGFTASLSSTAVVFKMFGESGELEAPHGRAASGILLVQDLALVPMMLLIPVLGAPVGGDMLGATALAMGKAFAGLAALLVIGRFALPRALDVVARFGTSELYPIAALVAAFGTAFLAGRLGLSLPIGAFLAGLALSGSRHAHQVFAELLPLRDAFVAVFFTSVGLLVEPRALASAPGALVLMLVAVLLKALVTGGVVHLLWRSPVTAVATALATAQIGEFAFVLTAVAQAQGLLPAPLAQGVLGATILTMAATPFLHRLGTRLGHVGDAAPARRDDGHSAHVLLLGYGQTGRAVGQVLRKTGIPFHAVDLEPTHVETALADGVTAHFGDASRRAVLEQAGAARMRAAVVAVGEPAATRRITSLLRQLAPGAPIIVRAHRVEEVRELQRLGASEVVPSEFEAAIEVFGRLFQRLGVPAHVVRMQESLLRSESYRTLLGAGATSGVLDEETQRRIQAGLVEKAVVLPGSRLDGRTIGESRLGSHFRLQVLAVVRADGPVEEPLGPDFRLQADDMVVLYGPHVGVARAMAEFEGPGAA